MPWYYAGPDANPVGPISLEELQARRLNGVVSPETYVIEHTGEPDPSRAWKRYRDTFPPGPSQPVLPPIPAPAAAGPPSPTFVTPAPPPPQSHPLFPSAAPIPSAPAYRHPTTIPQPAPVHPLNGWCKWGFGLGLASLPLLIVCGLGAFIAIPALFICVLGAGRPPQASRADRAGLCHLGAAALGSFPADRGDHHACVCHSGDQGTRADRDGTDAQRFRVSPP